MFNYLPIYYLVVFVQDEIYQFFVIIRIPNVKLIYLFIFITGISGKSQILFAIVYTTRYLDLFTSFVSVYNSFMKVVFLTASYGTLYLMFFKFKPTYDHNHDSFR